MRMVGFRPPTLAAAAGRRRTRPRVRDAGGHDGAGGYAARSSLLVVLAVGSTGCGSASVSSPPTGVDELVDPDPVARPGRLRRRRRQPVAPARARARTWTYARRRRRGRARADRHRRAPARRSPASPTTARVSTEDGRGRDRLVRPGRRRQRLVVRPRGGAGRPASTAPRPGWRCRRPRGSATATGTAYAPGRRPRTSRRCVALDGVGHGPGGVVRRPPGHRADARSSTPGDRRAVVRARASGWSRRRASGRYRAAAAGRRRLS